MLVCYVSEVEAVKLLQLVSCIALSTCMLNAAQTHVLGCTLLLQATLCDACSGHVNVTTYVRSAIWQLELGYGMVVSMLWYCRSHWNAEISTKNFWWMYAKAAVRGTMAACGCSNLGYAAL